MASCLQLKMDEVAVREKVDNLHSVLEDIQSGKVCLGGTSKLFWKKLTSL